MRARDTIVAHLRLGSWNSTWVFEIVSDSDYLFLELSSLTLENFWLCSQLCLDHMVMLSCLPLCPRGGISRLIPSWVPWTLPTSFIPRIEIWERVTITTSLRNLLTSLLLLRCLSDLLTDWFARPSLMSFLVNMCNFGFASWSVILALIPPPRGPALISVGSINNRRSRHSGSAGNCAIQLTTVPRKSGLLILHLDLWEFVSNPDSWFREFFHEHALGIFRLHRLLCLEILSAWVDFSIVPCVVLCDFPHPVIPRFEICGFRGSCTIEDFRWSRN